MVKRENYNIVSEAIVEDLLKKKYGDKIEKISGSGAGNIGDFRIGRKIIEVKGLWSDESGRKADELDFVSRSFTISDKEWELIQDNPKNFELWVVYRLDRTHKDVKGWQVKYAILSGTILKKCKPTFRKVELSIPKEFWMKSDQYNVPKKLWNKHKDKKKKNKER